MEKRRDVKQENTLQIELKMRLHKLTFVANDDTVIEIESAEDWVMQIYINGKDEGIVICPKNKSIEEWAGNIVSRIEANSYVMVDERAYLYPELIALLPHIS